MNVDVAIIGGTGVGSKLLAMGGEPIHVPTEAGVLRGRLLEIDGLKLLVLSRHSAGHKVPPHLVGYRAMALGCAKLNVKGCFATAAVGCLRPEWPIGTLVACSDFIDFTYRNLTNFNRVVEHCDMSEAFSSNLRNALISEAKSIGETLQPNGIYLASNGPRYESPAEIQAYAHLEADLVGMTATSEAILMREANVPYSCLAIVTNPAAGISETPLNHNEVVDEMDKSGDRALKLILGAAKRIANAT